MSMKATSRVRDSRGFTHSPGSRLSIDPDHHVTEAIGDMYGDYTDEVSNRYSFIASAPPGEESTTTTSSRSSAKRQSALSLSGMHGRSGGGGSGKGFGGGGAGGGGAPANGPASPPSSVRSVSPSPGEAANKQYPLNDIDYESDPVAVAQEISNLQALRRMSMDVTSAADPDLPSFNSFVPSTPPDDGGDPGSVFWVPARLHPELAPQEFSAFLEAKKNEIRRPQNGGSLSPDGSPSGGPSLRRKKSMLSRQIDADAARNYRDGAERLEKRKSLLGEGAAPSIQLDDLMKDPTALMSKLSIDSRRRMEEGDKEDDVPIIFAPKVGLKRSTATHYRKGSLRRGERVGSKRGSKAAETDGEEYASDPKSSGYRLDRVSTEPVALPSASKGRDELWHSRRSPPESSTSFDDGGSNTAPTTQDRHKSAPAKARRTSSPKGMPRSRTSEPAPPVPKIVETPPPAVEIPERHSSFEPPPSPNLKKRPAMNHRLSDTPSDATPAKTEHMVVPDKKDRKRPESSGTAGKDRKTSWGWLLGDSDKAREKEEQKEREKEEKMKAKKEKRPKSTEKQSSDKYDNTRLDVLQKSIELGNSSGKVVAADPTGVAASSDPSKQDSSRESSRKSRGDDNKKDKDSGFLSFFGGSRKKSGHDSSSSDRKGGRSSSSRGVSPDPAAHDAQPKYYYTRFPIHIERAIYRLSHLKLANPRRPLHQQVLLSNFMYSYLALVQQTQPHLIQQATPSPSKQQEAAERQRQQEQQRWQQRQEEEQRYAEHQQQQNHYYDDGSEYVDDSQGYDDDERQYDERHYDQQGSDDSSSGGYYAGQAGGSRDERDDMW